MQSYVTEAALTAVVDVGNTSNRSSCLAFTGYDEQAATLLSYKQSAIRQKFPGELGEKNAAAAGKAYNTIRTN